MEKILVYWAIALLSLPACAPTSECESLPEADAGIDGGAEPERYRRLTTRVLYGDADASCRAIGATLAGATTLDEVSAMLRACDGGAEPNTTCWTTIRLETANNESSLFVIEQDDQLRPVYDSWAYMLFYPLCDLSVPPEAP